MEKDSGTDLMYKRCMFQVLYFMLVLARQIPPESFGRGFLKKVVEDNLHS